MAAERPVGVTDHPDEHLVAAARAGEREAFAVLVERYREIVFAFAFAKLRDRDDAEDVAQDAFAKAFLSLDRLRGAGAWQSWLMRILRNLCWDALRRRRVRRTEPLDVDWLDGGLSPEASVLSDEQRRQLERAVADLPESLRTPLLMHFISRRSYREIAIALGVPETTVVGRTCRAVRCLRKQLKEFNP